MITESHSKPGVKPTTASPLNERRKRPSADPTPVSIWEPKATRLQYGYDPINEAGVSDGRYVACGAEAADCSCFGCTYRQEIPGIGVQIIERRKQPA